MTTDNPDSYEAQARLLDEVTAELIEALDISRTRDEIASHLGDAQALLYSLRRLHEVQTTIQSTVEQIAVDLVLHHGISQQAVGQQIGYSGGGVGKWVRAAKAEQAAKN